MLSYVEKRMPMGAAVLGDHMDDVSGAHYMF